MKVLYVSKALTTAAYRDKVRALGRLVEVTAVIPDRWRPDPEPIQNGEVRAWPVRLPGHAHLHWYRRPRALLRETRPDLVHVDEEPYSAATWQLLRASRRERLPAVFFAWQTIPKRLPPPFGAMRASVLRHAAGAIVGSPSAKTVLDHFGYQGAIAVIPQFGVDPARFAPSPALRRERRAALGIADTEFVVGFAGRLVPEKGVRVLVQAVGELDGRREGGSGKGDAEIRLLIVGDGPERRALDREARHAGLGHRFAIHPWLPSLEMPAWLNTLDVLVLPSLTTPGWAEQFGRVLVEAMACGVPVVGSDSGEIPSVIGPAGLVVPQGSAPALAEALRRLAGDAALRHDLSAQGRQRVCKRFTNELIAQATARFYLEVGGRTREPAAWQ